MISEKHTSSVSRLLSRVSRILERRSAYAQGKGYGTASIAQEVRQVRRLLGGSPGLAVDIGGNVGDYSAELLKSTPELEIHIFEPSRTNIDRLTQRFAGNPQIQLVPYGVSNRTCAATLYANKPGSGLGSLTKRNLAHFDIAFEHSEPVSVLRFEDYWLDRLDRRDIDMVKIDIEGHELAALDGFGDAILATRVLQFEFGGSNIDTRTYFQDFWYFFRRFDFELYRITPFGLVYVDRYREADETFLVTNYVAVNCRTGR
jgi:FkbM family methyltransferase